MNFAGYGVWFGPGDTRNEQAPLLVHEKQSITRAELIAAVRAIKNKCPGKPLGGVGFRIGVCRVAIQMCKMGKTQVGGLKGGIGA